MHLQGTTALHSAHYLEHCQNDNRLPSANCWRKDGRSCGARLRVPATRQNLKRQRPTLHYCLSPVGAVLVPIVSGHRLRLVPRLGRKAAHPPPHSKLSLPASHAICHAKESPHRPSRPPLLTSAGLDFKMAEPHFPSKVLLFPYNLPGGHPATSGAAAATAEECNRTAGKKNHKPMTNHHRLNPHRQFMQCCGVTTVAHRTENVRRSQKTQ